MPRAARFWRNVTIIAVAHVAVIIALVRWNREMGKANLQSIVWMSAEVAAVSSPAREQPVMEAAPPPELPPPAPVQPEESSPEPSSSSDIQLPPITPAPTPVATPAPKRTITPTPVPKPSVKPTPKKTVEPKVTPKPSPKKSPTPTEQKKTNDEGKKESVKVSTSNAKAAGDKSGSTTTSGTARSSEFSWYGKMLHDRFFSEWVQPRTSVAVGAKLSALVRIRIEKDGRISKFALVRPSGNVVVDESVAAVAKRVTQVDPLPTGLARGAFYEVNINFELNPEP
ncbi:MAG TPA: TonB C-terminal domain-containing protein [Chthoniobacterales bacterium]|nr:TonB C-terminal domain-containing protein [Chthoniobacterales bacterium]